MKYFVKPYLAFAFFALIPPFSLPAQGVVPAVDRPSKVQSAVAAQLSRAFTVSAPAAVALATPVQRVAVQEPLRTVVPERPDLSMPDNGVTWQAFSAPVPVAPISAPMPVAVPAPIPVPVSEISMRLVLSVNGQEHSIPIPQEALQAMVAAISTEASAAGSLPALSVPASAVQPGAAVALGPQMPSLDSRGVYRLQIGSFARTALAQACFDKLRSVNFDPRFERHNSSEYGTVYRVVLPGVQASEISDYARRLESAGFESVLVRKEN
jgi:hypothetical protein